MSEEQKSSRLAKLLGRRPPKPNEDSYHVVRERFIVQCYAVIDDPALGEIPIHQRICANPTYLEGDGSLPVKVGETEHRGDCTACEVLEDAFGQDWIEKLRGKDFNDQADLVGEVTSKAFNRTVILVGILTTLKNLS